jgi:hypothetical protein
MFHVLSPLFFPSKSLQHHTRNSLIKGTHLATSPPRHLATSPPRHLSTSPPPVSKCHMPSQDRVAPIAVADLYLPSLLAKPKEMLRFTHTVRCQLRTWGSARSGTQRSPTDHFLGTL